MQSSHLLLGRPLLLRPSTLPCSMAMGKDPSGRLGQTIVDLVDSFRTMFSWMFSVSTSCPVFRLCFFQVTPAILLEPSISKTVSILCASFCSSALYTRSTRDSYTLTLVVVIPVDDRIVFSSHRQPLYVVRAPIDNRILKFLDIVDICTARPTRVVVGLALNTVM